MAGELEAGKVTVTFTGETEGLEDALKRSQQMLAGFGKATERGAEGLSTFNVAAGVAGGTLAAQFALKVIETAQAVAKFAHTITEAASESVNAMKRLADETGVSLRRYQELEPVMRRNSVTTEQLGMVFRQLSRQIEMAQDPSSQAARSFEKLGLVMTGLESPSEVLTLVAERLSKMPPSMEKTRLQAELLGRTGGKLAGFMNEGAAGFKRSADEAHRMGNVLNEEANAALLRVNDSFNDLETSQDNLSKHLAVFFAPFVESTNKARKAMTDWAVQVIDQATIASRTLKERWSALSDFLDLALDKDVNKNFANTLQIWEEINKRTERAIAKIREAGVTTDSTTDSTEQLDSQVRAFASAQQKAFQQMSLDLTKMNVALAFQEFWRQKLIKSAQGQQALGEAAVKRAQEQLAAEKSVIDASLSRADTHLQRENELAAAYDAVAEAGERAALAGGRITEVDAAINAHQRNINAIDDEIQRVRDLQRANDQHYDRLQGHFDRTNASITERAAAVTAWYEREAGYIHQLTVLESKRNQVIIDGSARVSAARRSTAQADLQAQADIAGTQVRMLQSTYAFTDDLRAAQLAKVNADEKVRLGQVGLTEMQITAIHANAAADRMAIAEQFPTFFEQQLRDMVSGNAFSLSQITTQFTNATAQWIVTGQKFSQFWQQLQITLLQAFLNTMIQLGVKLLLHTSLMQTSWQALETAKTAIFGAGEAGRLAIANATNAAMMVMVVGSLASMMAIGNAALAIAATVATTVYTIAMGAAAVLAATAVGGPAAAALVTAATGMLTSSAIAIGVSQGVIQAAAGAAIVAATAAFVGMKAGGIVTGPTMGMIGEAGDSEAIIPLNRHGAAFMSDMLAMGAPVGNQYSQVIEVKIGERTILQTVADGLPSLLRLHGVPA